MSSLAEVRRENEVGRKSADRVYAPHDWKRGRTPDRYVSGFGGTQHAIYSPVGTPKPREECTPFTFTFAKPEGYRAADSVKAQEKFLKGLATLTKKQDAARKRREKLAAKASK